jgi:hypothetical protein
VDSHAPLDVVSHRHQHELGLVALGLYARAVAGVAFDQELDMLFAGLSLVPSRA